MKRQRMPRTQQVRNDISLRTMGLPSVGGTLRPATKKHKKPPLTPEKISVITKHFKEYLTKRNYPESLY